MSSGKLDLSVADRLAAAVLRVVAPAMARVEVAGSVRRRKPTVGDIEIVGIPSDRKMLLKCLGDVGRTIKPGVPGVVPWTPKLDAKYVRVRLDEGINLDVFLATPDNWGGLFTMRTGSGVGPDGNPFNGFIPQLFKRWKKVSGGGRMKDAMPTMPDGLQLACPEEEDFFELLGVEWVDPQDRTSLKAVRVKK